MKQTKSSKKKKQDVIKSVLAILLILLLVGTAIAPVFSETVDGAAGVDNTQLANEIKINIPGTNTDADANTDSVDGEAVPTEAYDSYFQDFIGFMVDFAEENYYKDVDKQALIEGAYKGIFDALDKHSMYFTPTEYSEFSTDMGGEFSGIGAVITDGENYVEVVSPIKDTPAYAAGILPGDKIKSVDGVDATGWTKEKAVTVIRGPIGTKVKLGLLRGSSDEVIYIEVTRALISVKTVSYKILEDGIGYIDITQFGEKTNDEFDEAMKYMKDNNVTKLIVDVRNNPGGFLHSAIHISDYFVDKGNEIVRVVYKDDTKDVYNASEDRVNMKLAVLVNEGSASAAEIFSGTVQQNHTGTIVGTNTYGKGTVQNVIPLTNGGGLKITIAEYLVPNEYHVDKNGVHPDYVIAGVNEEEKALYNSFTPMSETFTKYKGEISLNVYGAQQRLKFLGYDLMIDGRFGVKTEDAIKAFQKQLGLKGSGALTIETVKALDDQVSKVMKGEIDSQLQKAEDLLLAQ